MPSARLLRPIRPAAHSFPQADISWSQTAQASHGSIRQMNLGSLGASRWGPRSHAQMLSLWRLHNNLSWLIRSSEVLGGGDIAQLAARPFGEPLTGFATRRQHKRNSTLTMTVYPFSRAGLV
jgi:hypothetical protein